MADHLHNTPAPFVSRPGEGKRLPLTGLLKASDKETTSGFEVIEYQGPLTPPPHVHREHDEAFYIVEGLFTFVLGRDEHPAPAGSLVFVPRGTRHGFTASDGASALLVVVPGGLEGFFVELGAGLEAGRTSAEVRAALAGRYDSYPAD